VGFEEFADEREQHGTGYDGDCDTVGNAADYNAEGGTCGGRVLGVGDDH